VTAQNAISEADSVGELRALAHACYVLDMALVQSGRQQEATHSWRALEIYEQLGDPEHEHMVLNNLGAFAYYDGRWDEALALYERAGEASERAGRPADTAYTDGNIGEILSDQGHLASAEEHLLRARRVWNATGERPYVAALDVMLGRLIVRQGRYDEGRTMLESAMVDLRKLHVDLYADLAEAFIAEADAFGGDPIQALEGASNALKANDTHRPLLTRMAGISLARLGQKEAALRELRHALETARERASDYDIAATIDVIDTLGSADPDMQDERDGIFSRLRIEHLPSLSME
jgi:tetratricopeptide (TPR) repeat protein